MSEIRLIRGDCLEVLPMLAFQSVDMIWTDPPSGHDNNNGDLIHHLEAVLGRLPNGDFTEAMLRENYDGHGWEALQQAVNVVRDALNSEACAVVSQP